MRFLLDEGVTVSAGKALEAAGHEVIYFDQSGISKGSTDQLVCVTESANDAILVAQDNDMKSLAKGHGITPSRFRTLSLLKLDCREAMSAERIATAMSLVEHEWEKGDGQERRLYVVIGGQTIRAHR